jgi:hypothetical protein
VERQCEPEGAGTRVACHGGQRNSPT